MSWLLGPLFVQDLLRTTRRARVFLLRTAYLLILLLAFAVTYQHWFPRSENLLSLEPGAVAPQNMAAMAQSFTTSLLFVQFAVVLLLTPILSASAIAEEKETGTLVHLLTTPMSRAEIILGKWASRVVYLLVFFLAGSPIFAFLQLQGGLDGRLVLFAFGLSLCNIAGLAAVGMLCSVRATNSIGAIVQTYLLVLGYYVFSSSANWAVSTFMPAPEALAWIDYGNLKWAHAELVSAWNANNPGAELTILLLKVAGFHAVIAAACLGLAIVKLRPSHKPKRFEPRRMRPANDKERSNRSVWRKVWMRRRPPFENYPVLWKDYYCGNPFAFLKRLRSPAWLFACCLLFYLCFWWCLAKAIHQPYELDELFSVAPLLLATVLSCLLVLILAWRLAGTISDERQYRTLDCLLITALKSREILAQKWLAAFARTAPVFCLTMLALLLVHGLQGFGQRLLVLATFAVFYAAVGMYASCRFRKSFGARSAVLLLLLVHITVPYLLEIPEFSLPMMVSRGVEDEHPSEPTSITSPGAVPWVSSRRSASRRGAFDVSQFARYLNIMACLGATVLLLQRTYIHFHVKRRIAPRKAEIARAALAASRAVGKAGNTS